MSTRDEGRVLDMNDLRTAAMKMVEHIRSNPGHVSNCDEQGRMVCVTCGVETKSDPGAGVRR